MSIAETTMPRTAGTAGASTKEINLSSASEFTSAQDTAAVHISIDSVLIADRYRKDLGDVTELANSIVEIGLLNPVTVTEYHGGYRLVAGERRMRAFQSLGLTDIPARVARNIVEARDLLVAERDENTQRKEMLLSEATALGMAIQEMEAPSALDRMRAGKAPSAPGSGGYGHESREIAAEAVGLSRATYTRMKTLVTAATDENEPEDVREFARIAVEAIDKGASVRNGYDTLKETRRTSESVTVEAAEPKKRANDPTDYFYALAALHPTPQIAFEKDGHEKYSSYSTFEQAARRVNTQWQFTQKQWHARVLASGETLARSTIAIEVALSAIAERVDMQTITPQQALEALERLESASSLTRIIKTLKEITNV